MIFFKTIFFNYMRKKKTIKKPSSIKKKLHQTHELGQLAAAELRGGQQGPGPLQNFFFSF
jgi:hypothetical protein